jgi:hypothetical protein
MWYTASTAGQPIYSARFAWWTNSGDSEVQVVVKHAVIFRRRQTRWIQNLVVWMWQKVEKVLKIFSFRPESHAGTKPHFRKCCLSAVPAAVLPAAFANMEGLVTRCFQVRRNHFIRALKPSHLHVYRVVCSPNSVRIRRLLDDIRVHVIRGLLLVRHSLLHSTNERYSVTIYCDIWETLFSCRSRWRDCVFWMKVGYRVAL